MSNTECIIFYSWQSDLPNSTTRGLIQSSIEAAVNNLKNTVQVLADRDTRGVTGSPDIVQTIFSKIDDCDIFVADVTPVAIYHPLDKDGNESSRLKATPNANVMIELGYATQVVGWENIICIMNDDYNSGGEIPFDIEHHRLTHYSLKNKGKSEVRKELRDIIASTVMNATENGRRARYQFSNISIGSWNTVSKSVVDELIPYDIYKADPSQKMLHVLYDTAGLLFKNIISAQICKPNTELTIKGKDTSKVSSTMWGNVDYSALNLDNSINHWDLISIEEEEKRQLAKDVKAYLNIEIGADFFDFGCLKCRKSYLYGFADDYDGTEDEVQKYNDYLNFREIVGRIKIFERYLKTFDGLVLLPLAVKNESSISDSDIHISVQIMDDSAEIVYPNSELICAELKDETDEVYESGLIEMIFAQENTPDISRISDDKSWDSEDNMDYYEKELSRYVSSPEDGNSRLCLFNVSALHAKETKWLSRTLILRPLKENIRLEYRIKSSRSDGALEGILELKVESAEFCTR